MTNEGDLGGLNEFTWYCSSAPITHNVGRGSKIPKFMWTSFIDDPLIKVRGNGGMSERKVIGAHRHHPSIQSSKLLLRPDRLDRRRSLPECDSRRRRRSKPVARGAGKSCSPSALRSPRRRRRFLTLKTCHNIGDRSLVKEIFVN